MKSGNKENALSSYGIERISKGQQEKLDKKIRRQNGLSK